jgi:putative oligomerization/nucleic acid binding protein
MGRLAGEAFHPVNGSVEKIYEGFSWPCLFLNFLWYLHKGMVAWGVMAAILAFVTFGISWLIFPFFANEQYAKWLLKQGYLNEEQWNEGNLGSVSPQAGLSRQHEVPSVADELSKLAALKEQGVLTDDEFNKQKQKLLT